MRYILTTLVFCSILNPKLFAQIDYFPYFILDANPKIELKSYNGFATTASNDTLKGKINLQHWKGKKNVIKLTRGKGTELIPVSKLKMVRLFESDTSIIKTPYTDFYTFNNDGKLYRLLADSNYKVFDNLPYVKESISSIGNEIFVKENNKLTNTFDFWTLNTKRDLVKYVNERFNKKFKAKNFKNVVEIINYISNYPI